MRYMILAVAALAACSGADTANVQKVQLYENVPANPQTAYGQYKVAREAALTGTGPIPSVIPVTLPVEAPTAAQIRPVQAQVIARPAVVLAQATPGGYARTAVSTEAHLQACGRFYTDQAAQEAFLRAGGPEKDPSGLDPDGDGLACNFRPDIGL